MIARIPTLLRFVALLFALVLPALVLAGCSGASTSNAKANAPLSAAAQQKLTLMGSSPGEPMLIRIFKESSELEVWKRTKAGSYKLFSSYEICSWSGGLGPKVKEGDRQAPEGFYTITPGLMNPNSNYYLAFNTGFPNKFDRSWGRTGANLMVHGDCSSSGCYAMTDNGIKDIYALARETFKGGNTSFQLQIFPFRMTPKNLAAHAGSPSQEFWDNIKTGYDSFELTHTPPTWDVCNRQYVFNATGPGGTPLDAAAPCPALTRDATLTAKLEVKQQADAVAIARELASLGNQQAHAASIAEAEAAQAAVQAEIDAKAKARGEALGSFVSGVGKRIGIGRDDAASTEAAPIVDKTLVAPVPAPRIRRG